MIDYVTYAGWPNNVRLANDHAEIIVTLDVGPRVISYRMAGARNVFKNYEAQLGGTGEADWKIRGGHRFWLAPEDAVLSYIPDNSAVTHEVISPSAIEFIRPPSPLLPIEMKLGIALDPASSRVTVTHQATNAGIHARSLATWGLTVLAPGGIEFIPLPALGQHPRDLLPTRRMILWPYTDMTDARWQWGRQFITLAQRPEAEPTKLGLTHREGWAAYQLGDQLFLKTIPFTVGADYADLGCNFETFSNHEMLELEALGPLVRLAPGESISHAEDWHLFRLESSPPDRGEEDALAAWFEPFVRRAGLTT
ncbi:MAG: DUF4380 domain-containing protein [Verrucomicrobiota bacterium]|nr:DUF4380 domain-containing protein [Verrucomicrobiota bacterium]